ncbi:hypothetical protein PISMIDRAFT_690153 [Pisolithus microcarpus 441]|uniref:Uncharacterized protein n=1 Tax=Pisolithus microcarpus 441 TaxID=765257 RepID=A0A0C9YCY4_9AGAM|nr:hypothetical protein PISMIDRAFT_690153 [Pisolithus microcarpus 441]
MLHVWFHSLKCNESVMAYDNDFFLCNISPCKLPPSLWLEVAFASAIYQFLSSGTSSTLLYVVTKELFLLAPGIV